MNESQCLNRNTRRQSKPTDETQITSSNRSCQDQQVLLAGDVSSPLERLSVDNRKLISLVVTFQEQFELPSTEDIARLTVSNSELYRNINNICIHNNNNDIKIESSLFSRSAK